MNLIPSKPGIWCLDLLAAVWDILSPRNHELCNWQMTAQTQQYWRRWGDKPPFFQPAPIHLTAAVNTLLEHSNNQHVFSVHGVAPGWDASPPPPALEPSPDLASPATEVRTWCIGPDKKWFNIPISCRPYIGRRLLTSALQTEVGATAVCNTTQEQPDLWENLLMLSYQNIGFRKFSNSLGGITDAVLRHRLDFFSWEILVSH
jgi:hypothetical protein